MATILTYHDDYHLIVQYIQQLAADLGTTVTGLSTPNLSNLYRPEVEYKDDYIVEHFPGGMDWEIVQDPSTYTVTNFRVLFNGSLFCEVQGLMTPEELSSGEWPVTTIHGSNKDDWFFIGNGVTGYGGGGNDILELQGGAIAYGGPGLDGYHLAYFGDGGQMRIADYEAGEKILFSMYDSFDELASAFKGVTNDANGFTVHFGQPDGTQWSLAIEGTPLEAMRLEDLLVGDAGLEQLYAPLWEALGIA